MSDRSKVRIIIDLDLTMLGQVELRHNNDLPLNMLAQNLAKALSQNQTHIQGVKVEIEARGHR